MYNWQLSESTSAQNSHGKKVAEILILCHHIVFVSSKWVWRHLITTIGEIWLSISTSLAVGGLLWQVIKCIVGGNLRKAGQIQFQNLPRAFSRNISKSMLTSRCQGLQLTNPDRALQYFHIFGRCLHIMTWQVLTLAHYVTSTTVHLIYLMDWPALKATKAKVRKHSFPAYSGID